jgi:hypothetical protein
MVSRMVEKKGPKKLASIHFVIYLLVHKAYRCLCWLLKRSKMAFLTKSEAPNGS